MNIYLDQTKSAEERATDLIARMSLGEKMGQIVSFWPRLQPGDDSLFESQYPYGAGGVSMTYMRMLGSRKECVAFLEKWQRKVIEKSPHHIPAIMHLEGVSGAYIQGAVSFPITIGRAASFDRELEEAIGEIVGREESSIGVSHVFAPVLDCSRDPRNGRMGETYGEDATLVSALGSAYTKGIQQDHGTGLHIEAVAKHFVGFQGSHNGIESSSFNTSARELYEFYLKPFQACITESSLSGIMPCYTPVNGEGTSASKLLLTDILRTEMGFEGLVISDYTGISKLYEKNHLFESLEEAGYRSMEAGTDMETPFKKAYDDELASQFACGKREMAVLDRMVYRILVAKFRMGLFEHPFPLADSLLDSLFFKKEDAAIAKRSALESIVLIKNEQHLLPLSQQKEKVVVIGCHAASARFFFGGYTHYSVSEGNYAQQYEKDRVERGESIPKYLGSPVLRSDEEGYEKLLQQQKPGCKSLLEELPHWFPEKEFVYAYGYDPAGNDTSHFAEALEKVKNADTVIMTFGGKNGTRKIATMGEGNDSADIGIPKVQEKLIGLIGAMGKKIVGIHFDGRVVSSDACDAHVSALLEAWCPAEYGQEAICAILSGAANPSGKLPVTTALSSGQIPIYYNPANGSSFTPYTSIGALGRYVDIPHEPRYVFGHGLSYTAFAYSEMQVKSVEEGVVITCNIRNVGDREGVEIVQLYQCDEQASVMRPVQELVGFGRVPLLPRQSKTVRFLVHYGQLGFYNYSRKFLSERGWFTFRLGASSADIRLETHWHLDADIEIDERVRGFYADCSIS